MKRPYLAVVVLGGLLMASLAANVILLWEVYKQIEIGDGCHIVLNECATHRDALDAVLQRTAVKQSDTAGINPDVSFNFDTQGHYTGSVYAGSRTKDAR